MKHTTQHREYILGISAHYHDSAACLVKNGIIVAATTEERFTRRKHDASFPINSINYCLRSAGITAECVDNYVFYENPFEKARRVIQTIEVQDADNLSQFIEEFSHFVLNKINIRDIIAKNILALYGARVDHEKIIIIDHHTSHASSAFYPSGYRDAAVLCVDGVGEFETITSWVGNGTKLDKVNSVTYPHSLGLLYSSVTRYLGFEPNSGEYKVMGLAPYGLPRFTDHLRQALTSGSGFNFRLKPELTRGFVNMHPPHTVYTDVLGVDARKAGDAINSFHCDVACSIQQLLEEEVLQLSTDTKITTNQENLCLAGGVALNCVAAAAIRDSGIFNNVWVQPAASDAGGALGAALFVHYEKQKERQESVPMNPYLGPKIDNELAEAALKSENLRADWYTEDDIIGAVARRLANGDVVAIARGRMEYGPRALGNRSILADPRKYEMKARLNSVVKKRENFRPFAPVVAEEKAKYWFQDARRSPLMTFSFIAKEKLDEEIKLTEFGRSFAIKSAFPAATHVNQTSRVQTVTSEQNKYLWRLVLEFEAITGIPILLNTSFNGKNEPIVCSEIDAIKCFKSNSIDSLVLGNWLVDRAWQEKKSVTV